MTELAEDIAVATPRIARVPEGAALGRRSAIVKRSVELNGHKTSVSLEDEFWEGLRTIAAAQGTPLPELLEAIDAERGHANLSSAIRVFVFEHHRGAARKS